MSWISTLKRSAIQTKTKLPLESKKILKNAEQQAKTLSKAFEKLKEQAIDVLTRQHGVLTPYIGLMIIAFFVIVGNQANQHAYAAPGLLNSEVAGMDPVDVEHVLATLDPMTPEIEENPELVASYLLATDSLYLSRPELAVMSEAAELSKKDPIPYTVKDGDTMVSIAQEHGRTVATILDANGIKPEEAAKIKPGVELLIPQEDTSNSLAWLEAENQAKAEAARRLAEARAKAAAARSRSVVAAAATSRERSSASFSGESSGGFIVPIGYRAISRGISRYHAGIDYAANTGTPVRSGANGRVIEVTRGWAGGFGTSILVDHGGGLTSRYAHLSSVSVGIGQQVGQGEVIGHSGNTGNSTGPHLHFEVRRNGRVVSPF